MTCVRSSDFGLNDTTFECVTHLGNLLKPGDTAAGYDIACTVFNDDDLKAMKNVQMPDVILVKKTYAKKHRSKRRKFKLQKLQKDTIPNPKRGDEDRDAIEEEVRSIVPGIGSFIFYAEH